MAFVLDQPVPVNPDFGFDPEDMELIPHRRFEWTNKDDMLKQLDNLAVSVENLSSIVQNCSKKISLQTAQISELLRQNAQILELVKNIGTSSGPVLHVTIPKKPASIPVASLANLKVLDAEVKKTQQFYNELSTHLSSEMNHHAYWKTGLKACLKALFTTDVQILLNWEGASQKSKAVSLPQEFPNLYNLIISVIWSHSKLAFDNSKASKRKRTAISNEATRTMKGWLQGSGSRHAYQNGKAAAAAKKKDATTTDDDSDSDED